MPGRLAADGHQALGALLAPRAQADRRSLSHRRREARARVGYDYAHARSSMTTPRLAYAEVLDDEKAATAVGFPARALALLPRLRHQSSAWMTDNGSPTSRDHCPARAAGAHGIRHLPTRPTAPGPTARLCLKLLCRPQGGEAPRARRSDSGKGMPRVGECLVRLAQSAFWLCDLRSICRPAGCGRAGEADLIGEFAPMWLHRHRSVARRPGLDSIPEPGGHRCSSASTCTSTPTPPRWWTSAAASCGDSPSPTARRAIAG